MPSHYPRTKTPLLESTVLSLGLAALLGLVLAFVVYPPSFLAGDGARFHSIMVPSDAANYRMAWDALVQRGRPWPSLWTDLFNYPEGIPITLIDGLPLAATVFRPFLRWLPDGFHYFGLWHAVVVTLQGLAGVVFVRAAGIRHVIPCLCAALLALAMPIFVGRLNWSHISLSTQGLLIIALALCIHVSRKEVSLALTFPLAAALSLITLTVHPLLGFQVLLFCLLALGLSQAARSLRAVAALVVCLLFVALCHVIGIFAAESLGNLNGLGWFGFSPVGMIFGEPDYLRELYGARGPGIEQDAWLGWGCVLLLVAAFASSGRPRIISRYPALAWMILAFTIAAISPWIRVGKTVFDLSFLLPDWIINLYAIYRATVRLAWPFIICLTFLLFVHIAQTWPRRRAAVVLGIALALQCVSIWPYWAAEYREARQSAMGLAPPPPILDGASRLLFLDLQSRASWGALHILQAMHLAVETGIPFESGRFARVPSADPAHRTKDFAHSLVEPEARYLAAATATDPLNSSLPLTSDTFTCVRWEALLVCRSQRAQHGR